MDFLDRFDSEENLYLIPNYISSSVQKRLLHEWENTELKSHVFLLSSGTTISDQYKTYALSKNSLINNARSVNHFLNVQKDEVWLGSLPHYHVGGLSIYIRAKIGGQKVIGYNEKWDPRKFINAVIENKINYCSLVPTQLYDLVINNLKAPNELKGVFVGGDFLNSEIEKEGLNLGYPLIKTYGATETCSQIASSYSKDVKDGYLKVLPHHQIQNVDNRFIIKSNSLYTAELLISNDDIVIKKLESFEDLELPDSIDMKNIGNDQWIKPLGRKGDEIKINGKLFNFLELRGLVENELTQLKVLHGCSLMVKEDRRSGKKLVLNIEKKYESIKLDIYSRLKKSLPIPFDQSDINVVKEISRTALGKAKYEKKQ